MCKMNVIDLNGGGVKTGFGASMLNGEARFFKDEKWIVVELSAKVYDTDHDSVIVRLIELQYVLPLGISTCNAYCRLARD